MPNYGSGTNGSPIAIAAGDRVALFSAESPAAPQASVAIATTPNVSNGPPRQLVFTISAATATVQIQAANEDNDAAYNANVLHTSTNSAGDYYSDLGGFAFYRATVTAGNGVVTVEVH